MLTLLLHVTMMSQTAAAGQKQYDSVRLTQRLPVESVLIVPDLNHGRNGVQHAESDEHALVLCSLRDGAARGNSANLLPRETPVV